MENKRTVGLPPSLSKGKPASRQMSSPGPGQAGALIAGPARKIQPTTPQLPASAGLLPTRPAIAKGPPVRRDNAGASLQRLMPRVGQVQPVPANVRAKGPGHAPPVYRPVNTVTVQRATSSKPLAPAPFSATQAVTLQRSLSPANGSHRTLPGNSPRGTNQISPGPSVVQARRVVLRGDANRSKRTYIEDFEKIQAYLTERRYYVPALEALNREVEEHKRIHGNSRALSSVLLRREQQFGINSLGAPIYTRGLSGADFNRMLQDAVIPKDVGELSRHGEQTHRIQWYVVLWNMYNGFRTTDHASRGFNHSARDLLINSTKVQVPKENFPIRLTRGANVWHALFDMAFDAPSALGRGEAWDPTEDIMTSADLLGPALHGAESHGASRLEWGPQVRGVFTQHAPTVASILKRNYDKRYASEQDKGQGTHLTEYHQKKLRSNRYVEPDWSSGGILLPVSTVRDAALTVSDVASGMYRPQFNRDDMGYFTYLGHLLNDRKWDSQGVGFLGFGTKTPDGIVLMRNAYREGRYWNIFTIAEQRNRSNDSNRSPLVRDLYEVLIKIWNSPWHTLRSRLRELYTWDISQR